MNRYHQTVSRRVSRHYKGFDGDIHIGTICRNAEDTVSITAAAGTHCIHKCLIPFIHTLVLLASVLTVCSPAPAAVVDLIESLENKELTLVLEFVGNLAPDCCDLRKYPLLHLCISRSSEDVQPILAVASVMMYIDNGIKACRFSIAHDFRHSVKPSLVNFVIRSFPDMSEPGHRNSDCSETGRLQLVECSLSGLRIAPECFARDSVIVGIKVISEVPAQTESSGKSPGKISIIIRHNGSTTISTITRWHRSLGLQDIQVDFLFPCHDSKSCLTYLRQYILFYSHCHDCLIVCGSSFLCLYPVFLRYEIDFLRCSHCKSLLATFVGKFHKGLVYGQRDFFSRCWCFLTTSCGQKQ